MAALSTSQQMQIFRNPVTFLVINNLLCFVPRIKNADACKRKYQVLKGTWIAIASSQHKSGISNRYTHETGFTINTRELEQVWGDLIKLPDLSYAKNFKNQPWPHFTCMHKLIPQVEKNGEIFHLFHPDRGIDLTDSPPHSPILPPILPFQKGKGRAVERPQHSSTQADNNAGAEPPSLEPLIFPALSVMPDSVANEDADSSGSGHPSHLVHNCYSIPACHTFPFPILPQAFKPYSCIIQLC
ncbi:hypothetical protein OBBRIDRAFT_832917 [Obba rivulosa]|uniref:Uncharacterized protein n=1 Tax=Obba rivulosa TaxID=1052685 RepID=A0A8E2DN49_9APHY|nr:hypothetical protein OBBRIDRAFT_832917 [Obba rivulosa]